MKYRSDFVTNSSSTSFAAAAGSVLSAILVAFGLCSCQPERETEAGEAYTLNVSPKSMVIRAGKPATLGIAVYKTSEQGEEIADDALVNLNPASPDVSVSPDSGQGEFTVSVEVADDATPGNTALMITANVEDKTLTETVQIKIQPAVELELTFPVGRSPKVFMRGWVFGARCIANPGTQDEQDLSDTVKWSGTGSFSPETGSRSHPFFDRPGANSITLTCQVGEEIVQETFPVEAVSTVNYARMGDKAQVPADSHGCPACPHVAVGPINSGSPLVLLDGKPAARVGDTGVHAACCGANSFTIIEGDSDVLIDGKPAARRGHATQHCGGVGKIIEGAPM